MSWIDQLRQRLAVRLPKAPRHLKGHSLQSARRMALVYIYRDEQGFNELKTISESIAKEHDVEVVRFAFVDLAPKDLPHWMIQQPQSRFIAKDDVNLWGRPRGAAESFCNEPWDLLMNVETSLPTPLLHAVRSAQASMKVAVRQPVRNVDYDILFEPVSTESQYDRIHRMIRFLSTTQLT